MDIINKFLLRYTKEYDFYDSAAKICAQQIESRLHKSGIRAIVTYRAKNPERLREKLTNNKNEKYTFASVDEIYAKIVDLAGTRIALYFPSEKEEVDKIIKNQFHLYEKPKEFTGSEKTQADIYKKIFSGYHATHYRINLKTVNLEEHQYRYKEAKIEIQVASVLMHAWSEVEHDLIYKPLQGILSEQEYSLLDQLNGLVLTGEIALERLNKALELRVGEDKRKFANHYELSSYLFEFIKPLLANNEPLLGDTDILFALLGKLNLDCPEKLKSYLSDLNPDTASRSVAEQIIDRVIAADEERYSSYKEILNTLSAQKEDSGTERAIGMFIKKWIKLETMLRNRFQLNNFSALQVGKMLAGDESIDGQVLQKYEYLRRVRNHIVHGVEVPDSEFILGAAKSMDTLIKVIESKLKRHKE